MREWLGATGRRFCHKTQKGPVKCEYCLSVYVTVYGILFSPLWLKFVPGWPAISVSSWKQYSLGNMIWFGRMSDISQLASRVVGGVGGGGMGHQGPLIITLPCSGRGAGVGGGGGWRSFPLLLEYWFKTKLSDVLDSTLLCNDIHSDTKKFVSESGLSYPSIRIKYLDSGPDPILDLQIIVKSPLKSFLDI